MVPDVLLAFLAGFLDLCAREIGRRDWLDWLFAFAPILILLEIPRYYLPTYALAILKLLGRLEENTREREEFLRRRPRVSCVIAGRNEAATIVGAIRALLEQDYPPYEILVIDDNSDDGTRELARHAARGDPRVRIVRNDAPGGRGGRPSATNLGVRLVRGEFLLSLDADGTIDRSTVRNMIAPFADPRVGAVAGNVHALNGHENLLTRIEALEYAIGIDLHKRWTDLCDCTLMASGAIGAFRVSTVRQIGGWEPKVAEDSDISVRMRKAGWKIVFAPAAVMLTDLPRTLAQLGRQRARWDRGGYHVYVQVHRRAWRPSVVGLGYASELWAEWYFTVFATLIYPVYLLLLLLICGPLILLFVWCVTFAVYEVLSVLSLLAVAIVTPRFQRPGEYLGAALALPFYKGWLRWVRFRALVMELLGLRRQDPFLPESVWLNLPDRSHRAPAGGPHPPAGLVRDA